MSTDPMRAPSHPMSRYVLRRLLQAIMLLACMAVFEVFLVASAPALSGGHSVVAAGRAAALQARPGLDELAGRLVRLGADAQPAAALVLSRLGATLELAAAALALACVAGAALGAVAAWRRGGALDAAVRGIVTVAGAVPDFWLGQLLLIGLALGLGMLSMPLEAASGAAGLMPHLQALLLPAFALSLRPLSLMARTTRTALDDALQARWFMAARARGCSKPMAVSRHVLRPVASAFVAVLGRTAGFVVAGTALVEAVFGWPGIGLLLFDAVMHRDVPVMLAILLLASALAVLAKLLGDLLQVLVDPGVARA